MRVCNQKNRGLTRLPRSLLPERIDLFPRVGTPLGSRPSEIPLEYFIDNTLRSPFVLSSFWGAGSILSDVK